MKINLKTWFTSIVTLLLINLSGFAADEYKLKAGMVITKSGAVKEGTYTIVAKEPGSRTGLITIEGDNISIDFRNSVVIGAKDMTKPHSFGGVAFVLKGKNITIKNLIVKGYRTAIYAENSDNIELFDNDFSYNYRPLLKSTSKVDETEDKLNTRMNDNDEWMDLGPAVYLKNCARAKIRGNTISNGCAGLMMVDCSDAKIYNNNISYNSGVGIALYRSSKNKIMNNKIDYNVRGFSNGSYASGQESAGILIFENSNDNAVGYNSVTHCGNGIILWAGNTTRTTGKEGTMRNVVFGNDFSYSVRSGIETSYCQNNIANNTINDCTFGFLGTYTYNTQFVGNNLKGNNTSISIENGQANTIAYNKIENSDMGLKIFQNSPDGSATAYTGSKDVSSKDYILKDNQLTNIKSVFMVENTKGSSITENKITKPGKVLTGEGNTNVNFRKNNIVNWVAPTDGSKIIPADQVQNENFWEPVYEGAKAAPAAFDFAFDKAYVQSFAPEPFKDGMDVFAPPLAVKGKPKPMVQPTGRETIIMNEFGPYNFKYPTVIIKDMGKSGNWVMSVIGPTGQWKLGAVTGIKRPGSGAGKIPSDIKIVGSKDEPVMVTMDFEFMGADFTDMFGNPVNPKKPMTYTFNWTK